MKRGSSVEASAIVLVLFLSVAIPRAVISQGPARQIIADGKRIFSQSCAACHDTLGTATKSGPELKNYYHHQPHPADAAVRTVIHQGRGKMPGFSTLNKTQTDELVAYLKTL